jgi:regulator of RNase E activity RraA
MTVDSAFADLATSTIATAMDDLGLAGVITGLRPVVPGLRCAGPAVTVKETTAELGAFPSADFRVGHIIDAAAAGDVIVVDNGGHPVSTWGGLASYAARLKGIAGLIVDGGVRDFEEIRDLAFPVFTRHLAPTPGRTRIKVEAIGAPIEIAGVPIAPGDIVVADGTGIVRIPRTNAEQVLERARRYHDQDRLATAELDRGVSFRELLARLKKI